jgi:muramoyltetrapeptide carboxypeptidase
VSFHAPTARSELTELSRRSLERAVRGDGEPCGEASAARILRGGSATGPLVGGNLALITSLIGTPWALDARGAILVLEDVKESVYRIDRMLQQLRHSGVLASCAALLFGGFTERGEPDDNDDAALEDVLAEAATWVTGPVLAGVPVGHIDDQWTLPLGALAALDADTRTLRTVTGTA